MGIRRFFRGINREGSSLETRLFWFVAIASLVIEVIGIVTDLLNGLDFGMTVVNTAAVVITLITIAVSQHSGRIDICYVVLCLILNIAVIPTAFIYGGGFSSGMPCYILLGLVMCAVNPSLKRRILTVGISMAGYAALFVIAAKKPEMIRSISEQVMIRDQIIAVFVSSVSISLMLFLFLRDLGRIHDMNIREYSARKRMRLELLESQADNIEEAKRQRKEMRRHNMIITEYAEKGDFDGLLQYLADKQAVDERYTKKTIYCMNPTINTVLGIYARQAMNKKVPLELKTDVSQDIQIPEPELVSVISNVLESAINGAEQSPVSGRIVIADIHTRNGQLVINCKYSCSPEFNGKKEYAGYGGIGIQIVEKIIMARGGIMDFNVENGVVRCRVVINAGAEKK